VLLEAVRTSIVVNTASVAHTLGRAYSAADAVRAFSTATDPASPSGTTPSSNAAAAFPETRTASPTQLAFANAIPAPEQVKDPLPDEPVPNEPVSHLRGPSYERPAEPVLERSHSPVEGPVVAGATEASLPFTGLNVTTIAALGLVLMTLGGLGQWATRRTAGAAGAVAARL
jgi:hypothetical protein